ncbi:hypothetical protein U3516DRAFT_644314 [Neocallimastix sp. 'constans']|jgi:hypothetical protein
MNSKKFLTLLFIVVLLFAFVRAEEEDDESKEVEVVEKEVKEEKEVVKEEKPEVEEKEKEEEEEEEEKEKPAPAPTKVETPAAKPTTQAQAAKPTQKAAAPAPAPVQKQTQVVKESPKPVSNSKPVVNTQKESSNKPSSNPNVSKNTSTNTSTNAGSSTNKVSNDSNASTANNANANASANSATNVATNTAAPVAGVNNAATAPITNAVVPQVNNNAPATGNVSNTSNVSADNNVENKEEGGNGVVTTTVISLVAVGAVVGVATVGVNAYKKKANAEGSRGVDMADIEAQPINTDFGSNSDFQNNMAPEDYNPYNIMNDAPNDAYVTSNPYEYKPSYNEDVIDTTPFQKNETAQDNFMSRESIFSNSGNIPQIGNDVFNFGESTQLPYVQELPVENSYIDEPVANEIQVENYEMPNSQMPTLVPVEPEIVITQPEEEPAQEGYKQIVPNVAQMEIIETPDFNNMTTSMIEDHINNMDLENLANTETQGQEETDGGYKQIVPDIQEATIENFDIDDDEEDQDMSVVDNITDTYRAALRATYCSTTDDNRFSYRTVDSDHSLLHNMREDGEW